MDAGNFALSDILRSLGSTVYMHSSVVQDVLHPQKCNLNAPAVWPLGPTGLASLGVFLQ